MNLIKQVSGLLDTRTDQGGYAIFLSQGQNDQFKQIASQYGYTPLLTFGNMAVYRRDKGSQETRSKDAPKPINYDPGHNYLALYRRLSTLPSTVERDFELVFSQGHAHLFKRRAASVQDKIDRVILP
jgi:hypothetical protein